jgi:hypothetical protein
MARIDRMMRNKNKSLNQKHFFWVLLISILFVYIAGCLGDPQIVNGNQIPISTTPQLPTSPPVSITVPSVQEKIPDYSIIAKSEDIIRKFTKIPNQTLTFKGILNESNADVYEFKSGNSSFWVNNVTERVQSGLWYENVSKNQKEIIDLDQGQKIAEPYAKEKYPILWNVTEKRGIKQIQKADSRGDEKVFVYTWQEVFYNPDKKTDPHSEIPGLNSVTVEISPYTGYITHYHELYEQDETLPNVTATITEDEARMFAELYFESSGIPDVRQDELVSDGFHVTRDNDNNQRLAWGFSLTRTDKNGFDEGGVVAIDAYNGGIVWHASLT